jgi:hypothetical protein
MNKKRDNKIIRDIINSNIKELYCIKEGYEKNQIGYVHNFLTTNTKNKHTVGKKYSVYTVIKANSIYRSKKDEWWDDIQYFYAPEVDVFIMNDDNNSVLLIPDSSICEYFEVYYSIKTIRKEKIKRIPFL